MSTRTILILSLVLASAWQAFAQGEKKTITGTVRSTDGQTLPAAVVLVKGTNIGTTTDVNGHYEISVDDNATLIFSMMGFKEKEVNARGQSRIDVVLLEENQFLDEVVVTGYSDIERQHIASSVEVMDMEKVKSRPWESWRKRSAVPFRG